MTYTIVSDSGYTVNLSHRFFLWTEFGVVGLTSVMRQLPLSWMYYIQSLIFLIPLMFIAKQLIQNLLNTDPDKRHNIHQVLQHPWIAQNTAVPQTPRCTTAVLKEEMENWVYVHVFITFPLVSTGLFLLAFYSGYYNGNWNTTHWRLAITTLIYDDYLLRERTFSWLEYEFWCFC